MSGTNKKTVPQFLKGESLPKGYHEAVNPYISAPTCTINLGQLVAYAKRNNKSQWDLTKEEVAKFKTLQKNGLNKTNIKRKGIIMT